MASAAERRPKAARYLTYLAGELREAGLRCVLQSTKIWFPAFDTGLVARVDAYPHMFAVVFVLVKG